MKKTFLLILTLTGIVACSSNSTPTPRKLSQDVRMLPSSTMVSVYSEDNFPIPKNAQIIEQSGTFKTIDNTYDEVGNQVLIPRDAVISGTYTNDSVNCKVIWKSVYANNDEYEAKRGSFAISETAVPSVCDPVHGVKSGDRLTIRFNNGLE